jgi:hypothetical protein
MILINKGNNSKNGNKVSVMLICTLRAHDKLS